MSMSNLIQINLKFMDMKKHMLIFIFKSMLVDRKKDRGSYKIEVVIRKGETFLLWKLIGKKVVMK
jgi:hypothetical protein